jgi:hypothetical protein
VFQLTIESRRKPLPLKVSWNSLPPAVVLVGEIEAMDGTGGQVPQDTTIASAIASTDMRANLVALAIGLHLRQLADGIERYHGKSGWECEIDGIAEPHNSSARHEYYRPQREKADCGFQLPDHACILSPMPSKAMFRESRRSTRVPLRVAIEVESDAARLTCEGETIVVNLHGALLSATIGLSVGTRISIHVYLTDKRAKARVVYADSENPLRCGIEVDQPRNIWGVPLPPDDWEETAALEIGH